MNEKLKKLQEQLKGLWTKWSLTQKLILAGLVLVAIVGLVVLLRVSASPTMIKIISTPVKTEEELRLITNRLDVEGIPYQIGEGNQLYAKDEKTALRARGLLIRDDLIPKGTSPWAVFDVERWTTTDLERKVNLQRSLTAVITRHIEALDDVDKANVTIVWPEDKLFKEDQNAVTASVILFTKPGSDLVQNRKKVEGVQKILKYAVEGLKDDNIVITDKDGVILNDFTNMAEFDRITQTKEEQKILRSLEAVYRAEILKALQQTYSTERVRDLNVRIDMDMSKKLVKTEEYFPFTIKPDNPRTPYDDSDIVPSTPISKTQVDRQWQGTGFNPEGPAGAEAQTAPAYKDLQNMNARMTEHSTIENNAINKRNIDEVRSPSVNRVTASVNIDGLWTWKYDANGHVMTKPDGSIERIYTPVPAEELKQAEALVRGAVGYDRDRGDSVTVQSIPFDRTLQFRAEDLAFLRRQQINRAIVYSLIGIAALLLVIIVYRAIKREMERRRRIAEEKRAIEQSMLRENAIRQAEEQNIEVSMSVEERKRLELQEHAINMAKEHPEDVAQLIRTWLREE